MQKIIWMHFFYNILKNKLQIEYSDFLNIIMCTTEYLKRLELYSHSVGRTVNKHVKNYFSVLMYKLHNVAKPNVGLEIIMKPNTLQKRIPTA